MLCITHVNKLYGCYMQIIGYTNNGGLPLQLSHSLSPIRSLVRWHWYAYSAKALG